MEPSLWLASRAWTPGKTAGSFEERSWSVWVLRARATAHPCAECPQGCAGLSCTVAPKLHVPDPERPMCASRCHVCTTSCLRPWAGAREAAARGLGSHTAAPQPPTPALASSGVGVAPTQPRQPLGPGPGSGVDVALLPPQGLHVQPDTERGQRRAFRHGPLGDPHCRHALLPEGAALLPRLDVRRARQDGPCHQDLDGEGVLLGRSWVGGSAGQTMFEGVSGSS